MLYEGVLDCVSPMESATSSSFYFSSTRLFRPTSVLSFPRFSGQTRPLTVLPIPTTLLKWAKPDPSHRLRYSPSDITKSLPHDQWLAPLKKLTLRSLLTTLAGMRPIHIFKLYAALSVSAAAFKWVMNPYSLAYFGMVCVHWPWVLAISLAVYATYCLYRRIKGEANTIELVAIASTVIVWLTLVPPSCVTGFLGGWPIVFCLVYHIVFFMNNLLRKIIRNERRDSEEYRPPPAQHGPEWDTTLPVSYRMLFCLGVVAGHWLAAVESRGPHLITGGWGSAGIWAMIITGVFVHYSSTYYLVYYSEDLGNPTGVVQFGPYRWVRHPLYLSNMLTVVAYLAALGAPASALFVMCVCLVYYREKAAVEERLMMRSFGDVYGPYRDRVRRKFIPFVY